MKINVEFANGFFLTHNFGQRVCVEVVGNLLCLFYSLHLCQVLHLAQKDWPHIY